jgi:hypothetical protein
MRKGTDENPLTRKEADALLHEAMSRYKDGEAPVFTCSTCPFLAWCEFAYDDYNTNGDCLATK